MDNRQIRVIALQTAQALHSGPVKELLVMAEEIYQFLVQE